MAKTSRLLFVTQKIDEEDDDLAFVAQWVDAFVTQGFVVEVICLERGKFDDRFPVYSLRKEFGFGKLRRTLRFMRYIFTLKYDRVFVHMNPEYFTLGGWWWFITKKPSYLWYTHYSMYVHLRVAALFSKRMFAATKQSLPQYEGSHKKVILGHGVDMNYWSAHNMAQSNKQIVMVHRLSRSKRVELGIEALAHLPAEYTLTIYGRPIDPLYYAELQSLVERLQLQKRVLFQGPLPMPQLRAVYPQYRLMINMAFETIDKTMLEAMCNGVYPVTTKGNAEAIGLPYAPAEDTPQAIAALIVSSALDLFTQSELQTIVSEKHSLDSLVEKMSEYIRNGN